MKQKAALDAEMSLLKVKQEADVIETELKVMESAEVVDKAETDSVVSETRRSRTNEIIEKQTIKLKHLLNILNTYSQHLCNHSHLHSPRVMAC